VVFGEDIAAADAGGGGGGLGLDFDNRQAADGRILERGQGRVMLGFQVGQRIIGPGGAGEQGQGQEGGKMAWKPHHERVSVRGFSNWMSRSERMESQRVPTISKPAVTDRWTMGLWRLRASRRRYS
jgi:hypothetical protein